MPVKVTYCHNCGKKLVPQAKFCGSCGAPKAVASGKLPKKVIIEKNSVNIISPRKIIILMIATFGLFSIYWSYKQWQIVKRTKGLNILPAARGYFEVIFSFSLFKHLAGISKTKSWNPEGLSIIFVVAAIVYNLSGWAPASSQITSSSQITDLAEVFAGILAWVVMTYVMVRVQRSMNEHWKQSSELVPVRLSGGVLAVYIIIGIFAWIGSFIPPDPTVPIQ